MGFSVAVSTLQNASQLPVACQMVGLPLAGMFGETVLLPLITKTADFVHAKLSPFVAPAFTSIQNTYTYLTSQVSFPTLLPVVGAQPLCQNGEAGGEQDQARLWDKKGESLSASGQHAEALESMQKALEIWEKVLPSDHLKLAISYKNVGMSLSSLGRHAEALGYVQKALVICEKVLAPDSTDLAASYNNMGVVLSYLGRHAEALEHKRKALKILEKVLPPGHVSLVSGYSNMGSSLSGLGRHTEALEYFQKALQISQKVFPSDHPNVVAINQNMRLSLEVLGRRMEA